MYTIVISHPPISSEIESGLPNFNIKSYMLDINYDEKVLEFNYEIVTDDLDEITNLEFVVGTIYYNTLPVDSEGVKSFTKESLKYKVMELQIYISL